MMISRLIKLALLVVLFFSICGFTGCGGVVTPTVVVPPTQTPQPTETPIPVTDDCKFEEQTIGRQYQYRSSTGCGYFVIYSTKQHPDPQPVELVVRVVQASSEWQNLKSWETWAALFGTKEEAQTAVCNAVKNEGRTVAWDSILDGKTCP
jgi:hypothetical protein